MSQNSPKLQESKRSRELNELVINGLYRYYGFSLQLKWDGYIKSTIESKSLRIRHTHGKKEMCRVSCTVGKRLRRKCSSAVVLDYRSLAIAIIANFD